MNDLDALLLGLNSKLLHRAESPAQAQIIEPDQEVKAPKKKKKKVKAKAKAKGKPEF